MRIEITDDLILGLTRNSITSYREVIVVSLLQKNAVNSTFRINQHNLKKKNSLNSRPVSSIFDNFYD